MRVKIKLAHPRSRLRWWFIKCDCGYIHTGFVGIVAARRAADRHLRGHQALQDQVEETLERLRSLGVLGRG